jgi:hypothetical protein
MVRDGCGGDYQLLTRGGRGVRFVNVPGLKVFTLIGALIGWAAVGRRYAS